MTSQFAEADEMVKRQNETIAELDKQLKHVINLNVEAASDSKKISLEVVTEKVKELNNELEVTLKLFEETKIELKDEVARKEKAEADVRILTDKQKTTESELRSTLMRYQQTKDGVDAAKKAITDMNKTL